MTNFENSLIPVHKLIAYRIRAGRNAQMRGENNYHLPPPLQKNHSDQEYRFYHKNDAFLESEPIIKISFEGVEFASRTHISPSYIQILEKAKKTAELKRKTLQNYKERVERSNIERMSEARALGNTGSNLDNFEKKVREKRYRIQSVVQKNRLASNTVCTCGQPIGDFVHLRKNSEHGNISMSGIATCGSVWACPVCRAKIVNQRAKELDHIYKKGTEKGYHFHLLTFTFSHDKKDNLAELYGSSTLRTGLSGALTKFRQSRVWSKDFKKHIGFIGDIRSVEVTYGQKNGFHPHVHMIVISEHRFDEKIWTDKLLKQWQKNCESSGLKVPNQRGLKIDYVRSPEMVVYLCKWSVGSELSSDQVKESKNGNFSISELESLLIDEKERGLRGISLGTICGILKSYYSAMKGQKQLVFGGLNTGWKKELALPDVEDIGISSEEFQDEKEDHILIFEKKFYQKLRKDGVMNEIIERIEPLNSNVPGYHSLVYNLACSILTIKGYDHWDLWNVEDFNDNFA